MGTTLPNTGAVIPGSGDNNCGTMYDAALTAMDSAAGLFPRSKNVFWLQDYDPYGDGVHDDSPSFNAAVTAAANAGGGDIIVPVPSSFYLLSGPLKTTNGANAIIPFPLIGFNTSPVTITFRGLNRAPAGYCSTIGTSKYPKAPVPVIYGQCASPSGTNPCVFGMPNNWTNIKLVFRNIIFRQVNNPTIVSVNAEFAEWLQVENCAFDVDTSASSFVIAQPSNSGATALIVPANNNGAQTTVRDTFIVGYYTGLNSSEHAVLDNVFIQSCIQGINLYSVEMHGETWGRVLLQECATCIVAPLVGAHFIVCSMLDIEDGAPGSWYSPVCHISDPYNFIYGVMNVHRVIGGSGPTTGALTINGASNLTIKII